MIKNICTIFLVFINWIAAIMLMDDYLFDLSEINLYIRALVIFLPTSIFSYILLKIKVKLTYLLLLFFLLALSVIFVFSDKINV